MWPKSLSLLFLTSEFKYWSHCLKFHIVLLLLHSYNFLYLSLFFSECSLLGVDITLPEIKDDFLKKHLYYSISSNCLRIDACTDFSLDLGPNIPAYTKAFKAFIDVDFCKFIVSFGFEGWKDTIVLISYDWGKVDC